MYFVEVSGVSSGGTYQLTMTEVEDDDPGIRSLTVGGSVSGELDFARDEDVSQVELAAGTEYEVRLKATGWHNTSFERPELAQVLDVTDSGDPTEVTCETDHRRESCVFTASESGAYRITVHGVVPWQYQRTALCRRPLRTDGDGDGAVGRDGPRPVRRGLGP